MNAGLAPVAMSFARTQTKPRKKKKKKEKKKKSSKHLCSKFTTLRPWWVIFWAAVKEHNISYHNGFYIVNNKVSPIW